MMPVGMPRVRFSFQQHIVPPLFGVGVMIIMYGLLNFQAFESQARYYVAQFNPPTQPVTTSHSIAVDPNLSQLIVPGISVKAPVIYESSTNNNNIEYDLRSGIVHYGSTALPGQKGNVVIFGHSSGLTWAPGNYKFIFTLLDKLQAGQQITLDYKGTSYVYIVTDSQVVAPTDMKILDSVGGRSELTLVTCTPVGTSRNRLAVHATQLYPDPAANQPFKQANSTAPSQLPGN